MVDLPREIYLEIFSHLPQRHLRAVSQTCRAFTTLARPLMFEEISFSGDPQPNRYYAENGQINVKYPGRSRTVEIISLEATVDEVIALGIAPHVKRLKFSPKHYVEDFWLNYRQWLEDEVEVDDEADFHRMHEEEEFEPDDEYGYVGIRRIAEQRQTRPERERDLIESAEKIWAAKVEEQRMKAKINQAALTRLFDNMRNLRGIEINEWRCDIGEYGIEDSWDDTVEVQFAGTKTSWAHLELLSSAVQASSTRIQHLTLPEIDPFSIPANSSIEKLFSSLTMLSFNIEDIRFMEKGSSQPISTVTKLISCASQTLQSLEFRNHTTSHSHLPSVSEHLVDKLFGMTSADVTGETIPVVFPGLKTLNLRSIILDSPSLIAFLSLQPSLQNARFKNVYIATIGYTWADVAKAMPQSCTTFYISECGHELYGPGSPVASNHIKSFHPYRDAFPPHIGWRASEAFFEREQEDKARMEANPFFYRAPLATTWDDAQRKKDQLLKLKMCYTEAEFERI